MKIERRLIPDTELRLLILYALKKLGPVTNLQLLQFMFELDLMNYIELELNIAELEEKGAVRHRRHPLGDLLELTEEGACTLESFDQRVPKSRLDLIDEHSTAWHDRFRNEQLTIADQFPLSDGGVCVRLRLLENEKALLHLMLTLPHRPVELLEKRWQKAAQKIYSGIFALLTSDYDMGAAYPETPLLTRTGENEWLLSLESGSRLQMLLSIPDEVLGRCMAAHWEDSKDSVRKLVLESMELTYE